MVVLAAVFDGFARQKRCPAVRAFDRQKWTTISIVDCPIRGLASMVARALLLHFFGAVLEFVRQAFRDILRGRSSNAEAGRWPAFLTFGVLAARVYVNVL